MEEKFSYNYSADRNEELRKIREKYEIKNDEEQDKLKLIRAMDKKIEMPGKIFGTLFGLFFTFVFGGGLGLCIKTEGMSFVFGLFLGILGLLGMAFAPKITKIIFEKQKEKYGEEILNLIDKSMGRQG